MLFFCFQLLDILQRREALFSGTDLDDPVHRVNEDLAVSDVARVQRLLGRGDHIVHRDRADNDLQLHLGQQRCVDLNTTVFLTGALLGSLTV